MFAKTTEIRVRVRLEELEALQESLSKWIYDLSEALAECIDGDSGTQIIEVAGRLRATQAAKCKIDIQG